MPWTLRLSRVAGRALPGLLHEFSTPLSIIRNDSQFLKQGFQAGTPPEPAEILEVAAEVEAASDRLGALLSALKALPSEPDRGRDFAPVGNSVLTLLHNHWKYAWTVGSQIGSTPPLPCAEAWAWVAWAEALQLLTSALPGGTLTLTTGSPGFRVRLEIPGGVPGSWTEFEAGWQALLREGPLEGSWVQKSPGVWEALVWFQGAPRW